MENIFRDTIRLLALVFGVPLACIFGYIIIMTVLVAVSTPQLPVWMQPDMQSWMLGTPMPTADGMTGIGPISAGSSVGWTGYIDPDDPNPPRGVPLGPDYPNEGDLPTLGCLFRDPDYTTHTGVDFPAAMGTPVYTTMAGEVVWVGSNGPWGNLVVIENNGYQLWLAHFDMFAAYKGQIVEYGDLVGYVGTTGRSSGPHLHYGILRQTGIENGRQWLNPAEFLTPGLFIKIPCY